VHTLPCKYGKEIFEPQQTQHCGEGQAIHLKNTEEENRSFSVNEFLPFSLE
jgi:hypothetical protein